MVGWAWALVWVKLGCLLAKLSWGATYVLEFGIGLGHIRWHTKKIFIIGWSTHVLGMGIGLGQSRLYIGKIFIGCYLCLGNDRRSHLLEWMNGGLHAYLHPYISTPMYIYTIHSPIPYHIRQWGNFNPNTQYPIPNTTQHHGEISQTNWAPLCPVMHHLVLWWDQGRYRWELGGSIV